MVAMMLIVVGVVEGWKHLLAFWGLDLLCFFWSVGFCCCSGSEGG